LAAANAFAACKESLQHWLGNSAHLWMWDERSLAARLRQHGFVNIRRAACGDSEDPGLPTWKNPTVL
jgi:hypothetical protein